VMSVYPASTIEHGLKIAIRIIAGDRHLGAWICCWSFKFRWFREHEESKSTSGANRRPRAIFFHRAGGFHDGSSEMASLLLNFQIKEVKRNRGPVILQGVKRDFWWVFS
jgi:hypothetical protein